MLRSFEGSSSASTQGKVHCAGAKTGVREGLKSRHEYRPFLRRWSGKIVITDLDVNFNTSGGLCSKTSFNIIWQKCNLVVRLLMCVCACFPPTSRSVRDSVTAQGTTGDWRCYRIRTICQMENTAALHPFRTPPSMATGSCSGCSQVFSAGTGVNTGGFAQISQVWDGGFVTVWEL